MKISIELTLTPLQDEFEPAIIHLIKKLRASNLKVLENPLSTQVYGEYDEVMNLLKNEIKLTGVHIPTKTVIYQPILERLKNHGLEFTETNTKGKRPFH